MKRLFDILFAVLFIIMFWWVLIITYIIIKIVSPGPAIYKARRVGLHGRVFDCYKFRSMLVNSGKVRLTTFQNDERIFPFGKFIRSTKIDEIPQIVNILKGEMSVVGPRPEDEPNAVIIYQGKYKQILTVKPGLTSPASLYDYTHGEKYNNEDYYKTHFLPQKLNLELYYINNQSILTDIILVAKTGWTIIQRILGRKYFPIPNELNKFN